MAGADNIDELKRRRDALLRELAAVGDFRPGSLVRIKRKCGKPTCHCAPSGDPGLPGWALVRQVGGRTVNRGVPRGALVETRAQVAEHKRFRDLTRLLVEASEVLCRARRKLAGTRGGAPQKRGLRDPLTAAFAADIAAEIDALAGSRAADGTDFERAGDGGSPAGAGSGGAAVGAVPERRPR